MSTAATIAVDAPADVAAKAPTPSRSWHASAARCRAVSYPSKALPASEAAWRLFAGARRSGAAAGRRRHGRVRRRRRRPRHEHVLASLPLGGAGRVGPRRARPLPGVGGALRPRGGRGRQARRAVPRDRRRAAARPAHGRAHARHRHARAVERLRAVAGAAARAKAAATGRRRHDLARELRGLAELPRHRARGTDPNWCFERIAEIERSHDAFSTYFVLAGHHHPADGAAPAVYERVRPAIVTQVIAQGDELGLHPSYTASEDLGLIAEERARLEGWPAGLSEASGSTTCATTPMRRSRSSTGSGSRTTQARGTPTGPACGPACRIRTGRTTWPPTGRSTCSSCRSSSWTPRSPRIAISGSRPMTGSTGRSPSPRTGRARPAAPSRCSGTTTASTPPTHAGGTAPTTACWGGCVSAAGACARPLRPSGSRRRYAASVKRTRRRPPRATTVSSASTAAGMNCVPVQRRSSASAPSIDIALR